MNVVINILGLTSIVIVYGDNGVLAGITDAKWRQAALDRHNFYRANHGLPPLKLSQELCDISQKYADHLRDTKSFDHSSKESRKGAGENLFMSTGYENSPDLPVDEWYNEIKDYDFDKQESKNGQAVGHFTQVVWRESKEMCISYSKGDSIFVVANYLPRGNFHITGQRVQMYTNNVPRPIIFKGEGRNEKGDNGDWTKGSHASMLKVQRNLNAYIFLCFANSLIYAFA